MKVQPMLRWLVKIQLVQAKNGTEGMTARTSAQVA